MFAEYGNRAGTIVWVYRHGVVVRVHARPGHRWTFRIRNDAHRSRRVLIRFTKPVPPPARSQPPELPADPGQGSEPAPEDCEEEPDLGGCPVS